MIVIVIVITIVITIIIIIVRVIVLVIITVVVNSDDINSWQLPTPKLSWRNPGAWAAEDLGAPVTEGLDAP